ncbi:CDP-diacylglycerol--serine O-phosphatidyltransferase [Fulvivirgaceae bacterium PWU4]|uniref:CDP-diacylglycerol--serine O-phosphatidyltransferase n=1 Tax=Chryseosolibacter histidini TaxID=2782349 RepID=A0AAP2DU40_9BACT|nr:CDP-diacylglycerol--serine O-phosphatidyltransferase [Chryseosolibacter histidini]MBT1701524.1 CDP-diacylglycerol--serine O-phosphatidyltransferase [Chryseosolibacter histidini]
MKKNLPNLLTCCNLLCGSLGIVFLLEDRGVPAAYFVWAACLFDFFDGFSARMLKVASPIGKELDSLADVISFGLLPAMVMYKLIGTTTTSDLLPYLGFLVAVFSAVRLAIFNVDETQRDSFKGLNTPANSLFITSLPLIRPQVGDWLYQPWMLIAITIVFSLLLVSRIEIFALKFKNFKWAENRVRFTFLILSVLLLAILQVLAIPLIIILYIVLSLGDKALSG